MTDDTLHPGPGMPPGGAPEIGHGARLSYDAVIQFDNGTARHIPFTLSFEKIDPSPRAFAPDIRMMQVHGLDHADPFFLTEDGHVVAYSQCQAKRTPEHECRRAPSFVSRTAGKATVIGIGRDALASQAVGGVMVLETGYIGNVTYRVTEDRNDRTVVIEAIGAENSSANDWADPFLSPFGRHEYRAGIPFPLTGSVPVMGATMTYQLLDAVPGQAGAGLEFGAHGFADNPLRATHQLGWPDTWAFQIPGFNISLYQIHDWLNANSTAYHRFVAPGQAEMCRLDLRWEGGDGTLSPGGIAVRDSRGIKLDLTLCTAGAALDIELNIVWRQDLTGNSTSYELVRDEQVAPLPIRWFDAAAARPTIEPAAVQRFYAQEFWQGTFWPTSYRVFWNDHFGGLTLIISGHQVGDPGIPLGPGTVARILDSIVVSYPSGYALHISGDDDDVRRVFGLPPP